MASKYLNKTGLEYLWSKIKALFALKTEAIKNITRSGTTFTATRCDNTTFTFTQRDNNTWTAMVGATSSADGSTGYINTTPPKDGYNTKYWRADGTWVVPPDTNTTYTFATGDSNGQIKITPSGGSAQNVSVKGLNNAAYKDIINNTSVGSLGWTNNTNGASVVTQNTIAYWDGRYANSSNLAYCKKGEFGDIVTHAASEFATSGHTHSYLPLSGGTVTGTLILSKTTDIAGTNATEGALIIGSKTGTAIWFDNNEIICKVYNSETQTYSKGDLGLADNSIVYIPTVAANLNNTAAASTAWVRTYCETTKGFLTSHQSLAACIKNNVASQRISGNGANTTFYIDNGATTSGSVYKRSLSLRAYTSGIIGLYDEENSKYLLQSDKDGNVSFLGNASTATKLAASKTLWGQSFDGSINISGNMIDVGSITMTGNTTVNRSTITRGTTTTKVETYVSDVRDSANNRVGLIDIIYNANKTSTVAMYAYNTTAATGNSIGSISINCDTSGAVYTGAPTPSATTDNSTKIATTAWVRSATGNTALNAATATVAGAFDSTRSITLSGMVEGTASSTGASGWSITTNPKSCVVGQSGTATSKPWFKVASFTAGSTNDAQVTFLVSNGYRGTGTGILKVFIRTESTKIVNESYTSLRWLCKSTAFELEDFVLVCPTTAEATCELWVKVDANYQTKKFTVLSESLTRNTKFGAAYTLNQSGYTNGGSASIPTEGTQITSVLSDSDIKYATNVTGTVAIANGGTGATTRLNAFKAITNGNVGANATHIVTFTTSWASCGYSTVAQVKALIEASSSDERVKTDINDFSNEILDAWENVSWKQFRFKEDNSKLHAGLVAQQIKKAFDHKEFDLLKYDILCLGEDDFWKIRYTEALCIEAAYQRRKVKQLEQRIQTLETMLFERN